MISLKEFKSKIKTDENLRNKIKEKIKNKINISNDNLEAAVRSYYEDPVYIDEETADFIADTWAHGHSFFCYNSDSADALSSCCFTKDTFVKVKLSSDNNSHVLTFEELYNYIKKYTDTKIETIGSDGSWKSCKIIKLPCRPVYKIQLKNGSVLKCSDNHIHPTQRGDVSTIDLVVGDSLKVFMSKDMQSYTTVISIERIDYKDDIYCFEMEDKNDPYFVLENGILTHNCRLRNAIDENIFSYTLGAGGIQTGSKKVITMNINRITQDWYNKARDKMSLAEYVTVIAKRIHKYLTAWNAWLWDLYDSGLLTVYSAGFISLDKQFLTLGVNGFMEGAEFLKSVNSKEYPNMEIWDSNESYKKYAKDILETVKKLNAAERENKEEKVYKISIDNKVFEIPLGTTLKVLNNETNETVECSIDDIMKNEDLYSIDEKDLRLYRKK